MKPKTFPSCLAILIFLISLLLAQPASAHGDEPRLEISPERLKPGGVLDLRGVDFEFEEVITLSLVGAQMEVPLGMVLADTEGIFVLSITLPPDLAEGSYSVRATTDDHVVESAVLTVWGSADLGGGSDGPREEDDGLLAPMPTSLPSVPTAVPQPAVAAESTPAENNSLAYVWIAAAVAIAVLVGMLFRRRKA